MNPKHYPTRGHDPSLKSIILSLIFLMTPALTAFAATVTGNYTLYLHTDGKLYENNSSGADITAAMEAAGAEVSGSASAWRLTLTDFSFETTAATALQVANATTIELNGLNTVKSTYNGTGQSYGITETLLFSSATITSNSRGIDISYLTVNGDATLTATGRTAFSSYGIYCTTDMEINGGTLIATGDDGAISISGSPYTVPAGYKYWTGATTTGEDSGDLRGNGATSTIDPTVHKYAKIEAVVLAPTITSANSATVAAGGTFQVTATSTAPIAYALSGTVPAGVTINSASGLITVAASTAAGTYNFTVTASNSSGSDSQPFTLTVTATVTPTSYSVNIGTFKGGSVTAGSKSAAAGETVTLTVSPYTGYELDAITVHRTGSTTTVTLSGTGSTRTFTMPDSDVIIDATFKAATAAQILWEQALAVIVAATYDVPQSAAATEADLAAWLADYINGLLQTANINLSLKAADIWIISGSFAPVTSGTNGTFTFFPLPPNVSVSTLIDGTIVAGAVGNAKTDNYPSLQAYVQNGVLHVNGLAIGAEWRLYNVMGTLIYSSVANAPETTMPLPQRGVYIVTDGKTTVKVVN